MAYKERCGPDGGLRMMLSTTFPSQPRLFPDNNTTIGIIGSGLMCATSKAISLAHMLLRGSFVSTFLLESRLTGDATLPSS